MQKSMLRGDLEVMDGLNQAVTSPFGMGSRLTWLADTAIAQIKAIFTEWK